MKARPKCTVFIFILTVLFTEELTWNTKLSSTVCCQGKTQLLMWNFTKGENEIITELHWFLNETTLVCLESETTGFLVSNLYEGRVERSGTAGILLKNVSLNDTGEYTLYVKLEEETKRNVQGINLIVVDPPPRECKPIIKTEHPKGIISCFTSCERSPLPLEWIINRTKDSEVIGPYLVVDPLWTSEQPVCCLRDFKCVDDYQFKYCTPNYFIFTEDMPTVNQPVTDTNRFTEIFIQILTLVAVIASVVLNTLIILKRRCSSSVSKRHYAATQDMRQDPCTEQLSFSVESKSPHRDFTFNKDCLTGAAAREPL